MKWIGDQLRSHTISGRASDQLDLRPALVHQHGRLERALAGTDHGYPLAGEPRQVVVVAGVRDELGREVIEAGRHVLERGDAAGDHHAARGELLSVVELEREAAAVGESPE